MGFLDHSTNNIIVDAVLTDAGRSSLAKNDGSFQIHQFALGDDEVDYEIIKHFGRTVGKEKIEKNTPILEALTAGSLALKNKLVSLDNDFVAFYPNMTITAKGFESPFTFVRNNAERRTKDITIDVAPVSGAPDVDAGLLDRSFRVELNHLFLTIQEDLPNFVYTDNIAVYDCDATVGDGTIVATKTITLVLKQITDTTFSAFSTSGGKFIKTFVKVTGNQSGLTKTFEVRIKNPNT